MQRIERDKTRVILGLLAIVAGLVAGYYLATRFSAQKSQGPEGARRGSR